MGAARFLGHGHTKRPHPRWCQLQGENEVPFLGWIYGLERSMAWMDDMQEAVYDARLALANPTKKVMLPKSSVFFNIRLYGQQMIT